MTVQVLFFYVEAFRIERAAGIADTVQRGLGMLPQQAKILGLLAEKTKDLREPVQVYTACQFVKSQVINSEHRVLPNSAGLLFCHHCLDACHKVL